jgi:hypothetical protein
MKNFPGSGFADMVLIRASVFIKSRRIDNGTEFLRIKRFSLLYKMVTEGCIYLYGALPSHNPKRLSISA